MEVELTGVGVNQLVCIAAHGEHIITGAAEGLDIAAYTIVSRSSTINEDGEAIARATTLEGEVTGAVGGVKSIGSICSGCRLETEGDAIGGVV